MREYILLTGMVLQVGPIGEYDKRIVLLTRERGKITAFAKGARRQNSRLMAGTNPFSFGTFKIYEGKSYTVLEAEISYYFEELRMDFEGAYLGMYFMEFADYYARENNDERELLKLLFQSLRAITQPSIPNALVKTVFEIKAMVVNGEFPGIPVNHQMSESAVYTVEYIVNSTIEKLYTFKVSDEVLQQITDLAAQCRRKYIDRKFKSLEVLKNCMLKNQDNFDIITDRC